MSHAPSQEGSTAPHKPKSGLAVPPGGCPEKDARAQLVTPKPCPHLPPPLRLGFLTTTAMTPTRRPHLLRWLSVSWLRCLGRWWSTTPARASARGRPGPARLPRLPALARDCLPPDGHSLSLSVSPGGPKEWTLTRGCRVGFGGAHLGQVWCRGGCL